MIPTPLRWRYDGAIDAVEVVLPSGRSIVAERGSEHEVLPNEAAALASLFPEWQPVEPATGTRKEKR